MMIPTVGTFPASMCKPRVATGGRLTSDRVQHMISMLAADLGLEPRERGKILYRIRPHELGRDFLRTLCENTDIRVPVLFYRVLDLHSHGSRKNIALIA